jgi:hypothetical protein
MLQFSGMLPKAYDARTLIRGLTAALGRSMVIAVGAIAAPEESGPKGMPEA